MALKVTRGSGENQLFKLVVGKRVNCSFACISSGSNVRDKMVDMTEDGLVTAEAGCEGEFVGGEVAFDVVEGFGVGTSEGVDGLMAVTDGD